MTSLPVLPTRTAFCFEQVYIDEHLSFYIDGNSKITCSNGTYAAPKPNALSLPATSVSGSQGTCPGSTSVCRSSCYVHGLAKHAPDVYALYHHNANVLKIVLSQPALRRVTLASNLATWINAHASGGFRWHVSGDVRSVEHAEWIAYVCDHALDVQFWIYTRTLEAIPVLASLSNLSLNVSADAENYGRVSRVARKYDARICYLTQDGVVPDDLPPGSVIFPDYPQRGRDMLQPTEHPFWERLTDEQQRMVCPTDFFGQSEAHRCGPCRKCLT